MTDELTRERDKLRAEAEWWKSAHDTCCAGGQKLVDIIDELRAEVEAWRERDARERAELVRLRAEVVRLTEGWRQCLGDAKDG